MPCSHPNVVLLNRRPGYIWQCQTCKEIVASVEGDTRD